MADSSRAPLPGDPGLTVPTADGRDGGDATPGSGAVEARAPGTHPDPDARGTAVDLAEPGDGDARDRAGHRPGDADVDALDGELDDFDFQFDDEDEDDEDEEIDGGKPARDRRAGSKDAEPAKKPPPPVGRRVLVLSVGAAGVGVVALIVAVVFAATGFGPGDRPLLIAPLGLEGPPPATAQSPTVPQTDKVPKVVGMTFARARSTLEGAGYRVEVRYAPGTAPRETVVSQEPGAGTRLGRHGQVILVVSAGIVADPQVGGPLPTAPPATRAPTTTTRRPPSPTRPPATNPPPTNPPPTEPPPTNPPPTDPPPTTVGGEP